MIHLQTEVKQPQVYIAGGLYLGLPWWAGLQLAEEDVERGLAQVGILGGEGRGGEGRGGEGRGGGEGERRMRGVGGV